MTEQHPITPPPELRAQWREEASALNTWLCREELFINRAAQWGADVELEKCCEWLKDPCAADMPSLAKDLQYSRRPKPPSLKEQALAALNEIEDKMLGPTIQEKLIRKALESIND